MVVFHYQSDTVLCLRYANVINDAQLWAAIKAIPGVPTALFL